MHNAPEPQSNSDSGISEAINNAYNKGSPGGSQNNASGPEYDASVNVSRPLSGFGGGKSEAERSTRSKLAPKTKPNTDEQEKTAAAHRKSQAQKWAVERNKKIKNQQAQDRVERARAKPSKTMNLLDENLAKNMSGPELDYSTITVKPSEKPKPGEPELRSGIDLLSAAQKIKNAEMAEIIGRLNKVCEEKETKSGYVPLDHIKSPPSIAKKIENELMVKTKVLEFLVKAGKVLGLKKAAKNLDWFLIKEGIKVVEPVEVARRNPKLATEIRFL